MVAFNKKNTLEQTGFKLTADGFIHRGIMYKFDEVLEARSYRKVLETKYLLIGSDLTHGMSTIFVMNSGENVQLTEQPTLFSDSKLSTVEQIQEIFNTVSEKTFHTRARKYLNQVEENGYFEYAGWHFYPEQKKIIDSKQKRAYSIQTTKFLRSYGFIQVVNKADGFGAKISSQFLGPTGINTLTDTDVFFALFKRFFNLEWK